MAKVLTIEMEDGRRFQIPLEIVAKDRAHYYGKNDPDPDYDTTYKSEFEHTMKDESDAVDWYQNNMNPRDVAPHAKLVLSGHLPDFEHSDVEDVFVEEADEPPTL